MIERGSDPAAAPAWIGSLSHRAYPWLEPPPAVYPVTVVDMMRAQDRGAFVDWMWAMAHGTWEAWRAHHDVIRGWLDDPSTLPPRSP
jgi:hypothetical protein